MSALPEQNTQEWLDFRKDKVGASDVPVIMGVSPYQTPYQLWKKKIGFQEESAPHQGMINGHNFESLARELANIEFEKVFHPQVVQHPDHDWAIASLDGLSTDGSCAIEIKHPNGEDHEKAKEGSIPDKYYPQVQWQLFILNACGYKIKNYYYVSVRGDDFVYVPVVYDETYMNKCFYLCEQFHECLINFTPPEMTENDYLHMDDPEFGQAALAYANAKRNLEEAKKQEEYWKQQLIAYSDDGNCEGFGVRLTRVCKQGAIDWDQVVKDHKIDKKSLDKYRKPQIGYWKVTLTDNHDSAYRL